MTRKEFEARVLNRRVTAIEWDQEPKREGDLIIAVVVLGHVRIELQAIDTDYVYANVEEE